MTRTVSLKGPQRTSKDINPTLKLRELRGRSLNADPFVETPCISDSIPQDRHILTQVLPNIRKVAIDLHIIPTYPKPCIRKLPLTLRNPKCVRMVLRMRMMASVRGIVCISNMRGLATIRDSARTENRMKNEDAKSNADWDYAVINLD